MAEILHIRGAGREKEEVMRSGGIRVSDPKVVEAFKRISSLKANPKPSAKPKEQESVNRDEAQRVIWSGTTRGMERLFKTRGTGNLVEGDNMRIHALAAAASGEVTDAKGMLLAAALREALG